MLLLQERRIFQGLLSCVLLWSFHSCRSPPYSSSFVPAGRSGVYMQWMIPGCISSSLCHPLGAVPHSVVVSKTGESPFSKQVKLSSEANSVLERNSICIQVFIPLLVMWSKRKHVWIIFFFHLDAVFSLRQKDSTKHVIKRGFEETMSHGRLIPKKYCLDTRFLVGKHMELSLVSHTNFKPPWKPSAV